jgi:hypothetical protein
MEETQQPQKPIKIAHFSFANAKRDGDLGCSPGERLEAVYQFFEWCSKEGVSVIGCTEGHRAQNQFDWKLFREHVWEQWGYELVAQALLGDESSMSFGSQIYVCSHTITGNVRVGSNVTLTPKSVEGSRWVIRAPTLECGSTKLIYCHLSLSRDGTDEAYDNLLHELEQLASLVEKGWIAFGDFNLTQETRVRLYKEQQPLMDKLHFAFGSQQKDLSFITFPHDRVPYYAFENAPDAILDRNNDGCNCVAPLDAVCGYGVKEVHRFLPWYPFKEIGLDKSVESVVSELKSEEGKPPQLIQQWASDHWPLIFTV